MVDIVVQRGLGDRDGGIIEDPLIITVDVALQRGRNTIDEHSPQQPVALVTRFRTGVEVGQLVEVHDAFQGESWRGKIVGLSHSWQGGFPLTELTIRRPV